MQNYNNQAWSGSYLTKNMLDVDVQLSIWFYAPTTLFIKPELWCLTQR